MADITLPKSPYDVDGSCIVYERDGLYIGRKDLVNDARYIAQLFGKVFNELMPEYIQFSGLEQRAHFVQTDRKFGVFDNIPGNVAGALYTDITEGSKYLDGRLVALIMFNKNAVNEFKELDKHLEEYVMMHEMLHGVIGLTEGSVRGQMFKFYKHMAFISTGALKRKYQKMAKWAKAEMKEYAKDAYETVDIAAKALRMVYSELKRSDISDKYRAKMEKNKLYLEGKLVKAKVKKIIEKKMKKTKKKKVASGKKNKNEEAKGKEKKTKASKSKKSTKSKGKKK